MPLIATRGAASAQGFGEFAQVTEPIYIESVFSTYLYTGNGSTQTITNNIDLSTKGGLVWIKDRTTAYDHQLYDTVRGANKTIRSNLTNAEQTYTTALTAFNTTGFDLGSQVTSNNSGDNIVSWTFREQPKFFDIVTYTGNGTNGRAISHALASSPGCVIIKSLNNSGTGYDGWYVRHRSATGLLYLNLLNDQEAGFGSNITALSSTTVTVGGDCNENGETYVMYLFAHDAGGFGTSGSDNVITCGSYTGNGSTSGPTVTLNYEPQWLMIKAATTTGSWQMIDNMRGMVVSGNDQRLIANSTSAELTNDYLSPTATGFQLVSTSSEVNGNGQTYIYIAIRRGPMETPTSGTSVFAIDTLDGTTLPAFVSGFPVDMAIQRYNINTVDDPQVATRLLQATQLLTSSTAAESSASLKTFDFNNGYDSRTGTSSNWYSWMFRRAPGFFDVVCYTGTGSTSQTVNHNLGVTPELIIYKRRNSAENWPVASSAVGFTKQSNLNLTDNFYTNYDLTATNSTVIAVAGANANTGTYVAYLFASVAGVSKVGSYTGTGALQTVNCGFTGGARFVLIKRSDSTGDWWVYDSARGITSGNDPYLFLNSTAAEVTNTNYVDTTSVGFQVTAAAPAGLNANGGTYIFLAIA